MVMGLESTLLWDRIAAIAREEGVEIFDIELPSDTRRGGVLRVFITRRNSSSETESSETKSSEVELSTGEVNLAHGRSAVSFEDCVRVSKRILDADEEEEIIPSTCTLEVSSPGINRKLRLPEHFQGAVGERIRIKFRNVETGAVIVVTGVVRAGTPEMVSVEDEAKELVFDIPVTEIKEARVDFKF